jgi:hypothetical protein
MKNKKNTHITKDGRVARKGLYYYMNRAKKLGKVNLVKERFLIKH